MTPNRKIAIKSQHKAKLSVHEQSAPVNDLQAFEPSNSHNSLNSLYKNFARDRKRREISRVCFSTCAERGELSEVTASNIRESAPVNDPRSFSSIANAANKCEERELGNNAAYILPLKHKVSEVLTPFRDATLIALDTETWQDETKPFSCSLLCLLQLCDGENPPVLIDRAALSTFHLADTFCPSSEFIIQKASF